MDNFRNLIRVTFAGTVVVSAALALAACSTDAVKDPGAVKVRADLSELQSDPNLASRAPVSIHDAETAVQDAERPQTDHVLSAHLVYLADRRVQIAKAQAQTRFTEDQRKALSDQTAQIQLAARTHEADLAKSRNGALQAQSDAATASADSTARRNDELQAQLVALQAKKTDRGMVLTLGDVLFSTGRADLKAGSVANLDRLVAFLGNAPDRTVRIEGHTDNTGGHSLNEALSQKRADSVATYLTGRGIAGSRVTAMGESYHSPVADNKTEAGRQANRRVEVIIQTPPAQ